MQPLVHAAAFTLQNGELDVNLALVETKVLYQIVPNYWQEIDLYAVEYDSFFICFMCAW